MKVRRWMGATYRRFRYGFTTDDELLYSICALARSAEQRGLGAHWVNEQVARVMRSHHRELRVSVRALIRAIIENPEFSEEQVLSGLIEARRQRRRGG